MADTTFWLEKPVETDLYITDTFNSPRDYPAWPKKKQLHEGIDLKAVDASVHPVAVLAAQRGVVEKVASYPQGYGNYVRIRHDWTDGHVYITWYGHMSSISVKEGQFVQIGQKLGVAGSSGNSTGIHLHLTLQDIGHGLSGYVVDDVVDPQPYLRVGGPAPLVNEATFIADVTIPDGSILPAGQTFTKTWRIRNSGTLAWNSGYRLAFSADEPMGKGAPVPLPALAPAEEGEVSVLLTAPSTAGRHRSTWTPQDTQGNAFNNILYAEIEVPAAVLSNDATFLADVTIPDHSLLAPGQTFLKQWRVRNSGNTIWNNGFSLAFYDDEPMSAPAAVPVPYTKLGEEAIVGVTLTTPSTAGEHTTTWRMRNPQGQYFGETLFSMITVQADPTKAERDELTFVADVTFADGVKVQPGQVMQKVWRVRNSGTTTWGSGYTLAYSAGEPMGVPGSVSLPAAAPGQVVDVSVALTAPPAAGLQRSTWKAHNPQGESFNSELGLLVEVAQPAAPGGIDHALFIRDVTIPDRTVIAAAQPFLKTWRVRNGGTTTWDSGYALAFYSDDPMNGPESAPLPALLPGQMADVSVRLQAPLVPGIARSTWQPRSPNGDFFGDQLYALIEIPAPQPATGLTKKAELVEHTSLPPGSSVNAGESIQKAWRVRNTGTAAWDSGYSLAFYSGDSLGAAESSAIPTAEPLRTVEVAVTLQMPAAPGSCRSVWRLRDPQGNFLGPALSMTVKVKSITFGIDKPKQTTRRRKRTNQAKKSKPSAGS